MMGQHGTLATPEIDAKKEFFLERMADDLGLPSR